MFGAVLEFLFFENMFRKWRPIIESLRMGFQSLGGDRLRSFLSLLGITIGIFAIISVFTLVDTLERNLHESVRSLGEDLIFVQKWPWDPEGEYEWWEYLKRPQPRYEEFQKLRDRLPENSSMAFMGESSNSVHFLNNSVDRVSIRPVTHGFEEVRDLDLAQGRYFSAMESRNGRNVIVIGAGVAENLFPNAEPLGKEVKIGGLGLKVVGVIDREGSSLIGFSMDNIVLLPFPFGEKLFSMEQLQRSILVKGSEGMDQDALREEVRGAMRSIRRTPPSRGDDFALNEPNLISQNLEELFGRVDIAGAVIGLFSILVGGFSIANIMFVSVRERTPQIGIQKALGAKRSAILSQFLFESVFLCLIGGAVGLFLVFLCSYGASFVLGNSVSISLANILLGFGFSAGIGILAGAIPAYVASRLDPVEAIRS